MIARDAVSEFNFCVPSRHSSSKEIGSPVVAYKILEDVKEEAYNKIEEFVEIARFGKISERATNFRMQLPSIFASAVRLKFVNVATA
jgi:hypothetical protein